MLQTTLFSWVSTWPLPCPLPDSFPGWYSPSLSPGSQERSRSLGFDSRPHVEGMGPDLGSQVLTLKLKLPEAGDEGSVRHQEVPLSGHCCNPPPTPTPRPQNREAGAHTGSGSFSFSLAAYFKESFPCPELSMPSPRGHTAPRAQEDLLQERWNLPECSQQLTPLRGPERLRFRAGDLLSLGFNQDVHLHGLPRTVKCSLQGGI